MAGFTKQAIEAAFLQLLAEKPLHEISVTSIAERCGISRKSFYYYYQDIPALLEEIFVTRADAFIARSGAFSSLEECLSAAIETILSDKQLVLHVYRSVNRDIFERSLLRICDYGVRSYIEADPLAAQIPAEDRRLIIGLYRGECFGLISEWMLRGMQEDILPQFHRICQLRQGMVEALLHRAADTPSGF